MQQDIREQPRSPTTAGLKPPMQLSLTVRLPNGRVLTPTVGAGQTIGDALSSIGVALRLDYRAHSFCRSCHLRIADAWIDRLPQPSGDEQAKLLGLEDIGANSRLACQIELSPDLDGLEFSVDASCRQPQTFWVTG